MTEAPGADEQGRSHHNVDDVIDWIVLELRLRLSIHISLAAPLTRYGLVSPYRVVKILHDR
jgi:hypothetical protein